MHSRLTTSITSFLVATLALSAARVRAEPPAATDPAHRSDGAPSFALSDPALDPAVHDARVDARARRARRLSIAGWTLFGTGLATFAIGSTITAIGESRHESTCAFFGPTPSCQFTLSPGEVVLGYAIVTLPVALVGGIVGGAGTHLRRHPDVRVSLRPEASRARVGLVLRGTF